MTWKYISTSQTSAYSWKVEYPIWLSTSVNVYYKVNSTASWVQDTRATLKFDSFEKINYISCRKIDGSAVNINTTGSSVSIVFEPWRTAFEWCPDDSYRKIEIVANFKWNTKKILFNGMSGIVESVQ